MDPSPAHRSKRTHLAVRGELRNESGHPHAIGLRGPSEAPRPSRRGARNLRETGALGLRGTPGVIIGKRLVPGGLDYSQLVPWPKKEAHISVSAAASLRVQV